MTVSTEWPQVDSSMQAIAPPSSDDLFGADLLGDELMDIYNAAVVGGGNDNDEVMNEIPSLLGSTDTQAEGGKKDGEIDDGFGAFRPSTSFNNLSTALLENGNDDSSSLCVAPTVQPSDNNSTAAAAARVVSSTSLSPGLVISPPQPMVTAAPAMTIVTTPGGTKRKKIPSTNNGLSPKRKNGAGSSGSKSKKSTTKGTVSKKTTKKKSGSISSKPQTIVSSSTSGSALRNTALAPANPITSNIVVHPPAVAIKEEMSAPSTQAASSATLTRNVTSSPQTVSSASAGASTASVLSNPPTEADFKSVAQAAVNNLIMNAGNTSNTTSNGNNEKTTKGRSNSLPVSSITKATPSTSTTRVDTSTEHVKALTGSNWVAVCGGGSNSGDSNSQNNNDKLNRARRSNLTPDERARQNRDRNREHARNTRLRKKAYVEELKATLSALVTQRDAAELEKRHASQRELEQREVRFRVLEEFLKLRGRNESNDARWAAILEEKFTFTMPFVSYRDMVHSNDGSHRNYEQVLTGVSEAMNDSALCSNFLQSLGKQGNSDVITLSYNCDRSNFFMDNCVAMLNWTATTQGATEQGIELVVKGQIRAKFSPASNKLISINLSFDTGAVMSQVNFIANAKENSEADAAAAAAQVAANEADALLDSLEMPHFEPPGAGLIQAKMNIVPSFRDDDNAVISSDDE